MDNNKMDSKMQNHLKLLVNNKMDEHIAEY